MSNYMFQNVTKEQLNMVDNTVLSSGIRQYMEDDYSYNDAVREILKNEGWELRGEEGKGYVRFYNTNTKQYASVNRHNGMLVPTTTDKLCVNAFRVNCSGTHFTVEPNEWKSTYDSRRGKRLMKKAQWLEKKQRLQQSGSLNVSRQHY